VTPGSSSARIGGIGEDAEGRAFLRVYVTQAPEKGKANEGAIRLIAKALGLPRSVIEVVSGEGDRNKTVAIRGEPTVLVARLSTLVEDGE
jgi:uncharacterized protein YggU (UPF0235/DUF167 family)